MVQEEMRRMLRYYMFKKCWWTMLKEEHPQDDIHQAYCSRQVAGVIARGMSLTWFYRMEYFWKGVMKDAIVHCRQAGLGDDDIKNASV